MLGECVDALLGGHLPDLDGAVRGARDEVLVVGREGHAQHPARVPRQRRDQAPVTPGKEIISSLTEIALAISSLSIAAIPYACPH